MIRHSLTKWSRTCTAWAVILVLTGSLAPAAAEAADFSAWQHKMRISFPGYNPPGGGALTNFPVKVVFSNGMAGGFSYADFLSNTNQDLRFTASDSTTELNYEVDTWNTNGPSFVWVQVPVLANGSSIYAYRGMTNVTAQAYTTNGATWTNSFTAVWHMSQTNGGVLVNSTTNANLNGTPAGSPTSSGGMIGNAFSFNGASQFSVPGIALTNATAFTISWWQNLSSGSAYAAPVEKWETGATQILLRRNPLQFYIYTTNGTAGPLTMSVAMPGSVWWHLAAVYDGLKLILYTNGVQYGTTLPASTSGIFNLSSFRIGGGSGPGGSEAYHSGLLDELSIASVNRSSNWIWACYMNQASNGAFSAYNDVNQARPEINLPSYGATNMLPTSAWLNANLISSGGAPAYVWVYWDTTDRGTNKTWAFTNNFSGSVQSTTGSIAFLAQNLTSNTWYWYTYYVSNALGYDGWANSSSFKTPGVPAVDNAGGATNVYAYLAAVQGSLTNGGSAHVYVYWGTNSNAWSHTNDFGTLADPSAFATNLTGLTTNTIYYYQTYATNDYGVAWAPVVSFTTQTEPAGAKTWDGGAGTVNWFDAANWNPDGIPGDSDWVLLDNNAPSAINMGTSLYPHFSMLEITKSDADLAMTGNTGCYISGPTGLYVHTTSPRSHSMAASVNSDQYDGPRTWCVDGTGTVFSLGGATETYTPNGASWSKTGSGRVRVAKMTFLNTLTNLYVQGGLDIANDGYGNSIIGPIPNATMTIASNSVLWAEAKLVDAYGLPNLTGAGVAGDGAIMLNSSLSGSGTMYSMTSAGGTWTPGTDGRAGRLTVNGNLAFTTNGIRSNCTFKVDITGSGSAPVAGVDYDQLYLPAGAITATSLTNVNLIVKVAPTANTAGRTYRIIDDAAANFSGAGKTFSRVTWNGANGLTGTVNYANGYVELNSIGIVPRGSAVFFR